MTRLRRASTLVAVVALTVLAACGGTSRGHLAVTPATIWPGQTFAVVAACPGHAVPQISVDASPPATDAVILDGLPQGGVARFRATRAGAYDAHLGCGSDQVTKAFTVTSAPVVGLGDSYGSGEGASAYDPRTASPTDSCHRATTATAWEPGVAAAEHLAIDFAACSGAMTADFYRRHDAVSTELPQLDHLGPATRLVTMTIGGNDVGFAPVLADCVGGLFAPGGAGCAQRDGPGVQRALSALRGACPASAAGAAGAAGAPAAGACGNSGFSSLHRLYEDAARRSGPGVTVVVVGYPALFAAASTPCLVGNLLGASYEVAPADVAWLNATAHQLDSLIASEAGIAQRDLTTSGSAATVSFVDVDAAFAGHRLCDRGEPWIHDVQLSFAGLDRGTFHPTDAGQAAILRTVAATLPRS